MKTFSIKVIVVLALAFVMLSGAAAFADTVTYSTSGSFNGGSNVLTSNGVTLTFTGVSASVTAPTNISLGNINSAGSGTIAPSTFTLTVVQTVPGPTGQQILTTNLSGTVTANSNGISLLFSPTSFTINGINYTLQSGGNYLLVAPNTNNGNTSIQAQVTPTPEPASLLMLGGGLLAIGGSIRRKLNLI